jgi:hygromycin-B 7''-O-kinase
MEGNAMPSSPSSQSDSTAGDTGSETGRDYGPLLGWIADEPLRAALARFNLGDLVGAEPITAGFGQNLFLTSTTGRYVLRGHPHWDGQFQKERFLTDLLHERTSRVLVAWPYRLDEATDLFGWSYALMPRLPGTHERRDGPAEDQRAIARAVGKNLSLLHELTWPFAGDFDAAAGTVTAFPNGLERLIEHVRELLEHSRQFPAWTTPADAAWVEDTIAETRAALMMQFSPCFVMNDYKTGNYLVGHVQGRWAVTGVFDLSEGYFGNGEADLVRQVATYIDAGAPPLASSFVGAYLEERPAQPGFWERLTFFTLRDRLIYWDFGTTPGRDWFAAGLTFRPYAERYLLALSTLSPLSHLWPDS